LMMEALASTVSSVTIYASSMAISSPSTLAPISNT
jgi:hypothetical protein